MKLVPKLHERANQSIPIIYGIFLGPLLLALWGLTGRRAACAGRPFFAGGATAAMANIGAQPRGPGRERQPQRGRGAGGARARARASSPPDGRARAPRSPPAPRRASWRGCRPSAAATSRELDRAHDRVRVPRVHRLAAALHRRGRGHAAHALLHRFAHATGWRGPARRPGVELTRGLRTVAATDALIALRAGYPTCTLGGVDETKFPVELPLALGHARQPRLVEHRGRGGGLPALRARASRRSRRARPAPAGRGCPRGCATSRSCPPWRRSARA